MKYLLNNQETKRLAFRQVDIGDFDQWIKFHENPLSSIYWSSELESPEKECKKWYHNQFHRYENDLGGMNALVVKDSGTFIGHCGLLIQEVDGIKELEVAYSIIPEYWGRGYATEAAEKCINYAFENQLSNSLISIISITNIPSQKVAIKNGMKVDKKTVYKNNDVNIFRIRLSDWLSK